MPAAELKARWQYQAREDEPNAGTWTEFSPNDSDKLDELFRTKEEYKPCKGTNFTNWKVSYMFDFDNMTQTNEGSGKPRAIYFSRKANSLHNNREKLKKAIETGKIEDMKVPMYGMWEGDPIYVKAKSKEKEIAMRYKTECMARMMKLKDEKKAPAILTSSEVWSKAREYLSFFQNENERLGCKPGKLVGDVLSEEKLDIRYISVETFLGVLLKSKPPKIFAESEIRGDGSDWNLDEVAILGDMSIGLPVRFFDDGTHGPSAEERNMHKDEFNGYLIYTCGVLLQPTDTAVDYSCIVSCTTKKFEPKRYFKMYEKRLCPCFDWANKQATENKRPAFITIPGLGCGMFAGQFKGQLEDHLDKTLRDILTKHGEKWPMIKAVYFDPFADNGNFKRETKIHGLTYFVIPLRANDGSGRAQLSRPTSFQCPGLQGVENYDLYSFVAWDHVSWPGNDYWGGSRATDDGVKAASTDTMYKLTGAQGKYENGKYMPPGGFGISEWKDALKLFDLKFPVDSLTEATAFKVEQRP